MVPEGSLPRSQEPHTRPYPEPGHHRQSCLMTSFSSRIGMWNRREWVYKQYKCVRIETLLRSSAESKV
jgi:hypothetical protein